MNDTRKRAADFIAEYKKLEREKEIVTDQMYGTAELYRELMCYEKNDKEQGMFDEYKMRLERMLNKLNAQRGAIQLRMKLIESIIGRLSDVERLILRRYYIEGDSKGAADDLMEDLSYEKTHVYRLRDKALDKVAEMMDSFPHEDYLHGKSCNQT